MEEGEEEGEEDDEDKDEEDEDDEVDEEDKDEEMVEEAVVVLQAAAVVPRLENWRWLPSGALEGQVYDKQGFKDGELMSTSVVPESGRLDVQVVTSSGSTYLLGKHADAARNATVQVAKAKRRKRKRGLSGGHHAEGRAALPCSLGDPTTASRIHEEESAARHVREPAGKRPDRLLARMQCSICMETFDNPHSLPCTHTFCYECIYHWTRTASELHCPLCKLPYFRRNIMPNHTIANIVAELV